MKPIDPLPHPNDWGKTSLGVSVDIKRGVSWSKNQEHPEYRDGTVPVLRIGNIQNQLELKNLLYISNLRAEIIENKRVAKDWSIAVGSNGNRNRIGNAVLIKDDTNFLFASFLLAMRPKVESDVLPAYFYRWLDSEQIQFKLSATSEGTTGLNNLSHTFLRRLQISIPSKQEQKDIVYILDATDAAINQARDEIRLAKDLYISLISDAFEKLDATQKKLGNFITDIRYGTSQASDEKGWGYPTLRIPNVIADEISFDDLVYVNVKPADVPRLKLIDGDLLLVRTNGNPNYVGRSAVFNAPDKQTWIYASYLIRVRLKDNLIAEYVNVFLSMERGRRELLRRVTTSAGNHNINANSIKLIKLPVPGNEDEQKKIVEIANKNRVYINEIGNKLSLLEELKKALMHDLLTGKKRINNIDKKIRKAS